MRPLDSWFMAMDTYPWDKDAIAKIKNKEFSLIWALRLSKIPIANPLFFYTKLPINLITRNFNLEKFGIGKFETTLPK
jgi:hypothetical protein